MKLLVLRKDMRVTVTFQKLAGSINIPHMKKLGPAHPASNESAAELSSPADLNLRKRQSNPKPFYLRILPLGASIVEGYESSDGTGFRKLLRNQLRWKGWPVNMVGSKQNGRMADKVSIPDAAKSTSLIRNIGQ
jgi:hypothetical protein